jgi:hypothetical protein
MLRAPSTVTARNVAADEVGPAPIALALAQPRERIRTALQRLVVKVRKPTEKKVQ